MQDEINEKTVAISIKATKLTAQTLQKALKLLLAQMKKQHDKNKIPHGKQTLKQLARQNAGPVSYTHLDVYKRQNITTPTQQRRLLIPLWEDRNAAFFISK